MKFLPAPLRLRLHSPGEVISAVPYILGFHPSDSMVALGLRGTTLVFHARSDLPSSTATPVEISNFANYLARILSAQKISGAFFIAFGKERQAIPLLHATQNAIESTDIVVIDRLRVDGQRYWSYLDQDLLCYPSTGISYETAQTAISAKAAWAGYVAFPDRHSLVRSLGAPVGKALTNIRIATEDAIKRLSQRATTDTLTEDEACIHSAIERYASHGRLTDSELAWLTVLLASSCSLRDFALVLAHKDRTSVSPWSTHTALWTDVIQRCDPHFVSAPAVLLAYVCWRSGDGVRSGIAVNRALESNPCCPTAQLMAELLRRAVPPSAIDNTNDHFRPSHNPRQRVRRKNPPRKNE